jgi:hypothetical protein
MSKTVALFFYRRDGETAKRLASQHRKMNGPAYVRDVGAFVANEPDEPADIVFVLPCVDDFGMNRLGLVFGDKIRRPDIVSAPPPVVPPPPPGDVLASLSGDWETTRSTKELKQIAATIEGRAVENRAQAVEVIKAEVAKRSTPFPLAPPPV